MQQMPSWSRGAEVATAAPLILLFERNDAVAVPLLSHLRTAGYDVRAARIPVEVFDLLQRDPVELIVVDLSNAAANRREFWVGLDSQRRGRAVQVLTFRYLATGETGDLETGQRVARADVEIISANGFGALLEAVRARLPGATPLPTWDGVPRNMAPPPPGAPAMPLGRGAAPPSGSDASPFAQPYSDNPFKRRPGGMAPGATGSAWSGGAPPLARHVPSAPARQDGDPFVGFSGTERPSPTPSRAAPPINDSWSPPSHRAPRAEPAQRGVAYRGYDDEPLAPDDPRIEDNTSPIPALAFADPATAHHNERMLSTILTDSAVIAPQRIDALRSIQQTLSGVGMSFSLGDLAMLFKFLTPDQLLAAYLVSRGLVNPEQIASLGRIKQELLATGKDYDLEALLIMFNILPPDEIRRMRSELG